MEETKNSGYWISAWREVIRRPRAVISLAVILLYLGITVWVYT
ncbi:unnamed protein product, partial [marine sediment metagenome]